MSLGVPLAVVFAASSCAFALFGEYTASAVYAVGMAVGFVVSRVDALIQKGQHD